MSGVRKATDFLLTLYAEAERLGGRFDPEALQHPEGRAVAARMLAELEPCTEAARKATDALQATVDRLRGIVGEVQA